MSEHTKGPWRVRDSDMSVVVIGNDSLVAYVYTASDARLIAAAPDLLAACEEASIALADPNDPNSVGSTTWVLEHARELIATALRKAKGGDDEG